MEAKRKKINPDQGILWLATQFLLFDVKPVVGVTQNIAHEQYACCLYGNTCGSMWPYQARGRSLVFSSGGVVVGAKL